MVTDKTLRARNFLYQQAGHTQGWNEAVKATTRVLGKSIVELLERMQWFCTKHSECDDMRNLCVRKTDVPCKFRVLNPNYEEAMKEIRSRL